MSMLKKRKQRQFIKKQCASIICHLKSFSGLGKLEELHGIRLRLKKLHALASLSRNCVAHPFLIKQVKIADPLFKNAGSIRSAALTISLMNKYEVAATAYRQKLTGIIMKGSKKLGSDTESNIRMVKKMQRALRTQVRDIPGDSIRRQYAEELIKTEALFDGTIEIDLIHTGRKMIRDLLFIYKIGRTSLKAGPILNTGYLDGLQDTIGKWHDTVSSEQQLRKKSACSEEELMVFKQESDALLEKIHDMSRDFLLKAIRKESTFPSVT